MAPLERSPRAGAGVIYAGWERYREEFRSITRRALQRFETRAWGAGRADAAERLSLYARVVGEVQAELGQMFGEALTDPTTWRPLRPLFAEAIADRGDADLAETFFNSVTRHVLDTVGVDPSIEFVDLDLRRIRYGPGPPISKRYSDAASTRALVLEALDDFRCAAPYRDLERDAELAARAIDGAWRAAGLGDAPRGIELVKSVFFRGTGAYVVGRSFGPRDELPLILVLLHGAAGVEVDAVLCSEPEARIVFSFTRAHFHVDAPRPSDLVAFLSGLVPRKPIAELYNALGHAKHGKTELYRDLIGHLARSMDRFEHAAGDTGMVMIVFTLPSMDYVFKVIRDRFAYPKTNSREDVIGRYQLVFRHDRAGRLIEAQEFEHVTVDAWRFAPELLDDLASAARRDVTISGDKVVLHHLYVERRVRPLNLYLREAAPEEAERAVRDYGQAIRDLARTNIFPGDLLLKNFGVTRQGRVTFYDYDELCLVTDCTFRDLPQPRDDGEELAAEPWYYVGPQDVFPEEFIRFLGLRKDLREAFLEHHGEVLTAAFWRELQARHEAGEVLDVFPYPPHKRLGVQAGEPATRTERTAP